MRFTFKRQQKPRKAGNSSKTEIGLCGYQGLSLPKGDVSRLFIFPCPSSNTAGGFPSSRVLCCGCRTHLNLKTPA